MDVIRNNADRLSGIDQLKALMAAGTPPPLVATLGFTLTEIEEGRAIFTGSPDQSVLNNIGSVHGGYIASMMDSACGAAVHSLLTADQGYTTLELKVSFCRPLSEASGPVRAEGKIQSIGRRAGFAEANLTDCNGKLCATATATLLIFDLPPRAETQK
ncbi:PaaI family thioesterase [Rhizobium pisi]|uniref:PaaI family thioesterase n=1 Tax=Rhizobium pisi TaxID=574561 RepID=UPI003D01072A